MSKFRTLLQDLNAGDFLDVVGDIVSEQTRRSSNKNPAEMNERQYLAWADAEIKRAERAKAAEAAKEQTDGEG
jgi:hypothetical protein